jgi:hypothetical protein
MMGFEARNVRFCCVRDVGIFEENVFWIIKVRQVFYLMLAAFLMLASAGKGIKFILSSAFALFAFSAAFYPAKAISFEALIFGALMNFLPAKKRISAKLEKPKNFGSPIELGVDNFSFQEDSFVKSISRNSFERMRRERRRLD